MKLTFTISPKNTSFPILIINNQETSLTPEVAKPYSYKTNILTSLFANNNYILDISGVIRGPANAELKLVINLYTDGARKSPISIPIPGRYSNNKSFIFKTQVTIKKPTDFQGGRQ